MTTLQILTDILVKEYRVAPDQVIPEATLTTLGLDSLSVIELMFKIEDTFGINIDNDTPTDLVTINDVVGYIDSLLASKSPARSEAATGSGV